MCRSKLYSLFLVTLLLGTVTDSLKAQQLVPASADGELKFTPNVELRAIVELVSQKQGIRILYDESLGSTKITIKAPGKIPVDSLLSVLASALKMKGFALVDADIPGWKQIVRVKQLPDVAIPGNSADVIARHGASSVVTQAFVFKYANPAQVAELLKPFLTQRSPGSVGSSGNSILLENQRMLIVTDYASNFPRLEKLIALIDKPTAKVVTEYLVLKHAEASEIAKQLNQIRAAQTKAQGKNETAADNVAVTIDARTNRLILVGTGVAVEAIKKQAKMLDTPLGLETKAYPIQHVSADRIQQVMEQLLDQQAAGRLYKSGIDKESNLLIVTTTPTIHRQLEGVRKEIDVPIEKRQTSRSQSRIRFYKLKYVSATDVLQTIQSIEQSGQAGQFESQSNIGQLRSLSGATGLGPNQGPLSPGQELPTPPGFQEQPDDQQPAGQQRLDQGYPVGQLEGRFQGFTAGDTASKPLLGGNARVTADVASNTIIVVADPSVQEIYKMLIERIDQRRPQVLIEAKIIVIDTSDGFSLGIDASGGDRTGAKKLFAFNSFGLSSVDESGLLSLASPPGNGFSGVLLNPDVADVVIRALVTHGRSRVLSAPRILVDDNATGNLTSVAEEPFTSVNASQTVSTTSFAGFAEAGTTITVTPHISEGDHLQLEYKITLNSFGAGGGDGVPPPRQTDDIDSKITIPDGHTVIVGGLNRLSKESNIDTIPWIEKVPLVKHLFANQAHTRNESTLFVFIRPTILRDDKFRDLKYLSDEAWKKTDLAGDTPTSEPIAMRSSARLIPEHGDPNEISVSPDLPAESWGTTTVLETIEPEPLPSKPVDAF